MQITPTHTQIYELMHTGSNVFVRLVSYANDYGGVAATAVLPWSEW